MKKRRSKTFRTNKIELELLVIILRENKCPKRAAEIIRLSFWKTLTRKVESPPSLYIQTNLFET